MTVETKARKQSFAGGQASLTFTFKGLEDHPEDIKVVVVTSGTETLLTYTTHYTVSMGTNGVGGVVTVSPSYSTAYTYTVYRETERTQESDYDDYNQFPADTLETDLDRRALIEQELEEELGRTVRVSVSSSVTGSALKLSEPVAKTYISWSDDGLSLVNRVLPDPSVLEKATQAVAEAATDNDNYMTALQVKNEVQKSGAVAVPIENIPYKDEDAMTADSAVHVPTQQSVKAYVDGKIIDEDNMVSALDTKVPTQQSVKAYADTKLADGVLTDYFSSSTIVGWTSPAGTIYYKKTGKLVHVWFVIQGVSNATGCSFTLPYAKATGTTVRVPSVGYDNGSFLSDPSAIELGADGTVIIHKNYAENPWTNSGNKYVWGYICFPTDS